MKTYAILTFSLVAALARAETSPFVGTWKSNESKSHLTGDTITYSKTAKGYKRSAGEGSDLEFAIDGKEYKDQDGYVQVWTADGTHAWDSVLKLNGKVMESRHIVLSPDGKTMTWTYSSDLADGTKSHGRMVRTRTGPGTGLAGRWKTTEVTEDPVTVIYSEPAPGRLHFEEPSRGDVMDGPTDGTEFEMQSPNVPPGWVATFKTIDAHEHAWTGGFKGKPEVKGTSTVSADGTTLTIVSWSVGKEAEKTRSVFDKQ